MGAIAFLGVGRGSTAMPPCTKDEDSPSLLGKVSQAAVDRVLCWAPIACSGPERMRHGYTTTPNNVPFKM